MKWYLVKSEDFSENWKNWPVFDRIDKKKRGSELAETRTLQARLYPVFPLGDPQPRPYYRQEVVQGFILSTFLTGKTDFLHESATNRQTCT